MTTLSLLTVSTLASRTSEMASGSRHSDSLCETEVFHQARHCYSWRPGHQCLFHRLLENVNKRRLNFLSLSVLEYDSQEFVGLKRVRFH